MHVSTTRLFERPQDSVDQAPRIDRAWHVILLMTAIMLISLIIGSVPSRIVPRTIVQTIDMRRGRIVDHDGLLLASDDYVWEIYLDPSRYEPGRFTEEQIALAARKLQIEPADIMRALGWGGTVAQVANGVSREQCETADNDPAIPIWLWCDSRLKRTYPQGTLGSQFIGFAYGDQLGAYGVEAFYDEWLRSSGGWTPALGEPAQTVPTALTWFLPSSNGRDLALTMHASLQYRVERALVDVSAESQITSGTVIIMDPTTGDLLALANWPAFDPNVYWDADPGTWENRAISRAYEPGTLFSLITIGSALDAGTITTETKLAGLQEITVGGRTFTSSNAEADAPLNLTQVLASSDTVAPIRIALDLGAEEFYRYVAEFGFGRPSEVDLSYEVAGIVKGQNRTDWAIYDLAANSFGQDIFVTPLQMIGAIAAIANDGTRLQPRAVTAIVVDGQMYGTTPRVMGQPIRPRFAQRLVDLMVRATEDTEDVNIGPGFTVAGHMGKSEIAASEPGSTAQQTASFVGFFPAEAAKLIILVKLDGPGETQSLELAATSLFSKVGREAVEILDIEPSGIGE